MIEQQVERRLYDWLQRDAASYVAPAGLQQRVLDIPTAGLVPRPWSIGRFSLVAAPATAVVVAAAVFASSVFNVFDRPTGTEGGLCNNRQVQRALDSLRDAPGYRYEARDELYDFDLGAEFSFDDPQFAWRTGLAAEGAYRAPDRVREIVTVIDGMDRGYSELIRIGETTWKRGTADGGEAWMRTPSDLPTANMVYGYVQAAFPAFQVPGVTSLDWGGTPAPDDIPGTGGCTVATLIPGDGIGDIVALRIEIGSGLPIGVYRGPPVEADVRHGAQRHLFALTWTTPDEGEFTPPADAVDAPAGPGADAPPPGDMPAQTPLPNAWQPQDLPLPDGWSSAIANAVAHLGPGGLIAVGTADRLEADGSYESEAVVWSSANGETWELVPDGPDTDFLSSLAWDGETLLAVAWSESDGTVESEIWLSPDGREWALVESFEGALQARQPVPTRHGWVAPAQRYTESSEAGGGIQMSPAMLHSADGREWTEIALPGTGSGSLGSIVELPNGTLMAFGCESPGATNATQFGEMCLSRPWRSEDGQTWTPGDVLDLQIGGVVLAPDGLLAIGTEATPGDPAVVWSLYRSDDGETWTEEPFNFGVNPDLAAMGLGGGPERILVVGGEIIVEGTRAGVSPTGRPYPAAWRSTAEGEWAELPIGFTDHGGSVDDIDTADGRVLLIGWLTVDESQSRPVVWLEPTE